MEFNYQLGIQDYGIWTWKASTNTTFPPSFQKRISDLWCWKLLLFLKFLQPLHSFWDGEFVSMLMSINGLDYFFGYLKLLLKLKFWAFPYYICFEWFEWISIDNICNLLATLPDFFVRYVNLWEPQDTEDLVMRPPKLAGNLDSLAFVCSLQDKHLLIEGIDYTAQWRLSPTFSSSQTWGYY